MNSITRIDFVLLDAIQTHWRSEALDYLMAGITHVGDVGAVWIVLTLVFLLIPRTRLLGLTMLCALVVESLCVNLMLKPLVGRERPFALNDAVSLFIAKPLDYSFPSGHSGASFAAACGLAFAKAPKGLWIPALCLAALIAFSRVYLYVHYPSDVVAGAIIGTLAALLAARVVLSLHKRWRQQREAVAREQG